MKANRFYPVIAVILIAAVINVARADEAKDANKNHNSAEAAVAEQQTPACEKIVVADVVVGCLKNGVGTFSAKERAEKTENRIDQLARDYTFDPASIVTTPRQGGFDILAGDVVISSLSEGDIPLDEGETHASAVSQVVGQTRKAIEEFRLRNRPETILRGLGYTLLATLVFFLGLFIFRKVSHFVFDKIRQISAKYIPSLKIQHYEIVNSTRVIAFASWVQSAVQIILTLVALYIYIPMVFSFFPWTEKWTPILFAYILNPVKSILQVVINYLPNLFYVVIITIFIHYVLKVIRFFFIEIARGALQFQGFHREWADPTYKLVRVLVVAMGFVMAFPYLPGSSSPAFQGVSVFLGLLVSFGSSSAISNIVSGIVITYMRPFKSGDRVKIADTMGDIVEKNLLVTRIRSIKNVEITIPNSMVLSSHIVNYSTSAQDHGLILHTTVTIGYDVPWQKVHELLLEAARRSQYIDQEKKSFILQTALNDFSVAYELNAYTTEPNKMILIYSELHKNIQNTFQEAGVEIMSPNYTAIRDGNAVTIPAEFLPPEHKTPSFRVSQQP